MKLYQERLNLFADAGFQENQEESVDPLLEKLGFARNGDETGGLTKKDYNYLMPLLVAYKHKLSVLDKHLTERYKLLVRRDNDLTSQMEIQQKIIDQIENKQQEALNLKNTVDPVNADYASMGNQK